MKHKSFIIPFALLFTTAISLSGCRKDMTDNTPRAFNDENKAYVQWFNAVNGSLRNFIFANGQRINGATVAFGTAFPSGSPSFAVHSGTTGVIIKDTLTTSAQVPQDFVQEFRPGKSYSIFSYGVTSAPKRLVVENSAAYPGENSASIRFVNLIHNTTTPPNVDIYSVNQGVTLFTNIPVASITDFMAVQPYTADTWQVRQTGTSTVLASLAVGSLTINAGRRYTLVFRGTYGTASTRALAVIATQ